MTEEDDDFSEQKLREHEYYHREFVQPAIGRVKDAYDKALTRLWTANGAGSLASVSFVGGVWHQGPLTHMMLYPLLCFVVGLIAMATGTMLSLQLEAKIVRSLEQSDVVRAMKVQYIRRPSQVAGLTLADWRTRMAYISAGCFLTGAIIGLAFLWKFPATGCAS